MASSDMFGCLDDAVQRKLLCHAIFAGQAPPRVNKSGQHSMYSADFESIKISLRLSLVCRSWKTMVSELLSKRVREAKFGPGKQASGYLEAFNILLFMSKEVIKSVFVSRCTQLCREKSLLDTLTACQNVVSLHVDYSSIPHTKLLQFLAACAHNDKTPKLMKLSLPCSSETVRDGNWVALCQGLVELDVAWALEFNPTQWSWEKLLPNLKILNLTGCEAFDLKERWNRPGNIKLEELHLVYVGMLLLYVH